MRALFSFATSPTSVDFGEAFKIPKLFFEFGRYHRAVTYPISILHLHSQAKGAPPVRDLQKKFEGLGMAWTSQLFSTETLWVSPPSCILVVDESPEFVAALRSQIAGLPTSQRWVPILYAYSATKFLKQGWDWENSGVAEVFSVSEKPAALELKLRLRLAHSAQMLALQKTSQDHASALAKTDTVLKQREEFLSVCAHDLRSPLALIQTCLSMVLKSAESTSLSTLHSELLARAQRQSGHALTLVKDLLDVTALEQGLRPQYQVLKLDDLLKEFFSDYRLQAEQKNVRFHYTNPVQSWKVLADGDRIRQLLQNLFTNALKFTDPGKNIYLDVAPFQGRRKTDPPYPMLVIKLRDEGKGIPASEMRKIFDRFVQIKEQSREGGRGLGLTVAKQISTLHDGNIWVESEEGKGSTFSVLFPHTISQPDLFFQVRDTPHLLVAEPSAEKRKSLFGMLEQGGYRVSFVSDGVEAITHLFHCRPSALILSSELAKISIAEVTYLLKSDSQSAQVPILLASSNHAQAAKQQESTLADAVLSLPIKKEELHKVLGVLLFKKQAA